MWEMLANALFISVLGMAVTFTALGLVMLSMILLTGLASAKSEPDEGQEESAGAVEEQPAADAVLPAGAPLEHVAAAAVAVAAARELARQRQAARVWLPSQPRSLVSPWQLMAREKQSGLTKK